MSKYHKTFFFLNIILGFQSKRSFYPTALSKTIFNILVMLQDYCVCVFTHKEYIKNGNQVTVIPDGYQVAILYVIFTKLYLFEGCTLNEMRQFARFLFYCMMYILDHLSNASSDPVSSHSFHENLKTKYKGKKMTKFYENSLMEIIVIHNNVGSSHLCSIIYIISEMMNLFRN